MREILKKMNNSAGITTVYLSMLRKLLYIAAAAAAVILTGLVIVFPVWYLAAKYPSVYTISIALGAVFYILYSTGLKLYRKQLSVKSVLSAIARIFYLAAMLLGASAVVILYMNSLIFQGSVIMTVLFLTAGLISWLKKKKGK